MNTAVYHNIIIPFTIPTAQLYQHCPLMSAIFKVSLIAQECADLSVWQVCDAWTNIGHCVEFLNLLLDLTEVTISAFIRDVKVTSLSFSYM